MLETLRIRNLALIDDVELEFCANLNVLTGESGARSDSRKIPVPRRR